MCFTGPSASTAAHAPASEPAASEAAAESEADDVADDVAEAWTLAADSLGAAAAAFGGDLHAR